MAGAPALGATACRHRDDVTKGGAAMKDDPRTHLAWTPKWELEFEVELLGGDGAWGGLVFSAAGGDGSAGLSVHAGGNDLAYNAMTTADLRALGRALINIANSADGFAKVSSADTPEQQP